MIPLVRERTSKAINKNFRGSNRISWEKELLEEQREIKSGTITKHKFVETRWKVVKSQLRKESYEKCAYCEVPYSTVAYGDVEHYRPKSIYWWLAYNYDNYLVSCQICNQTFKSDNFPIKNTSIIEPNILSSTTDQEIIDLSGKCSPDPLDDSGMLLSEFINQHNQERPYLINPYFDNPEDYYAWKADDNLKEVELIPISGKERFVECAIEFYGLNRKELKDLRYYFYKLYSTFTVVLKDNRISDETKNKVKESIEEMKNNKAPFAGMIRYFEKK